MTGMGTPEMDHPAVSRWAADQTHKQSRRQLVRLPDLAVRSSARLIAFGTRRVGSHDVEVVKHPRRRSTGLVGDCQRCPYDISIT